MTMKAHRRTTMAAFGRMILFVAAMALLFSACAENPPKAEREAAEKAFLAAKRAEKCAPLTYASAEKALLKARELTTNKQYDEARQYFKVAEDLSRRAQDESEKNVDCDKRPGEGEEAGGGERVGGTGFPPDPELDNPNFELKRVHFPFNSDELTEETKEILAKNAAWMERHPATRVRVEGHADERGSTEYNLALGERRAGNVRDYLVSLGADRDKLEILSFGEEQPLDSTSAEEAWAMNRRAEFRKLGE